MCITGLSLTKLLKTTELLIWVYPLRLFHIRLETQDYFTCPDKLKRSRGF